MVQSNIATVDPIRDVAFGSITNAFVALGSPIASQTRILSLNNLTNGIIQISLDGTNVNFQLAPTSYKIFNISANAYAGNEFCLSVHVQLYVRYVGSAPSSGDFWVEVVRSHLV